MCFLLALCVCDPVCVRTILCACVFAIFCMKMFVNFRICFVCLYAIDLYNYGYLCIVCFSLSCKVL